MGRCFVWANLSVGRPYIFCDRLPWIAENRRANTWTRPVAVRQRSLLRAAGAVYFLERTVVLNLLDILLASLVSA